MSPYLRSKTMREIITKMYNVLLGPSLEGSEEESTLSGRVIAAEHVFLSRNASIQSAKYAKLADLYFLEWEDAEEKEDLEKTRQYVGEMSYWIHRLGFHFGHIDPRWKDLRRHLAILSTVDHKRIRCTSDIKSLGM